MAFLKIVTCLSALALVAKSAVIQKNVSLQQDSDTVRKEKQLFLNNPIGNGIGYGANYGSNYGSLGGAGFPLLNNPYSSYPYLGNSGFGNPHLGGLNNPLLSLNNPGLQSLLLQNPLGQLGHLGLGNNNYNDYNPGYNPLYGAINFPGLNQQHSGSKPGHSQHNKPGLGFGGSYKPGKPGIATFPNKFRDSEQSSDLNEDATA